MNVFYFKTPWNNILHFLIFLLIFKNVISSIETEMHSANSRYKRQNRLTRNLDLFIGCPHPPDFPIAITLTTTKFQSYARDITVPEILTAIPRDANDVLLIVNWAYKANYRVRASGGKHNFSPFMVSSTDNGKSCPKIILVDTTTFLITMKINSPDESGLASVTVGPGVKLLYMLQFIEEHGYGLFATPAIGSISVGGMLTTGTHGTGIPDGNLDSRSSGHTSGTLSNLIIEMTLVAWDEITQTYVLKTIHRSNKDCKAFLVHLGRTFVTSVTLRVGKDQNLRTQSHFFVTPANAFANPDSEPDGAISLNSNMLESYVNKYGRVDCVYLPTSKFVWIMTWHEEKVKPLGSRFTLTPFNYIFINYVPSVLDHLSRLVVTTVPAIAKLIGTVGYIATWIGVTFTWSGDYWGKSKNHLMFVSKFTPHLAITGFAFLTSKSNLQKLLWTVKNNYDILQNEYEAKFEFPINGGSEFRITGIDIAEDVGIFGAEPGALSPARPSKKYPHYDTVLWIDIASFLGTPKRTEFLQKFQSALYRDINEDLAIIRPEWSKEWAFTNEAPFTNTTVMQEYFPQVFAEDDAWNWTISVFDQYDPHKVFSNDFLDKLLVPI